MSLKLEADKFVSLKLEAFFVVACGCIRLMKTSPGGNDVFLKLWRKIIRRLVPVEIISKKREPR